MRNVMTAALTAVCAFALIGGASAQDWNPDRPINIIVPWSAGGSTDQVTRVAAPLLEEALGQPVVVVNQPGASGATGTQAALAAPRDGYTWTANAVANNATYAITGLVPDTSIADYRIYLHVANIPVISVNPDSPWQDMGEFLEAMKGADKPTVATAGVNSSGGMALAALQEEGGGEGRMIAYDGGGPAAIATAGGEAQATTQLASEQAELIKGGKLRPLAALSDKPLEIDGIDPIPPITNWLPDMHVAPDYFGILIPTGAPQEVYDRVDQVWQEKIMNSPEFQSYARERGAVFDPSYGDDAMAKAMPVIIAEACARVERGEAVVQPSEFGIDCETRTAN
ncbi:MAG TPA: tripartite tricarboxylate transporter substrate binding protein [Methylomirabilota bacterium]|nr:tripartite tricarboxylate transporter substrate binding protein [Methylomirabilota bacterium]